MRLETHHLLHFNVQCTDLLQKAPIRRREWEVDTVRFHPQIPFLAKCGLGIGHLFQKFGETLCERKLACWTFLPSFHRHGTNQQEGRI